MLPVPSSSSLPFLCLCVLPPPLPTVVAQLPLDNTFLFTLPLVHKGWIFLLEEVVGDWTIAKMEVKRLKTSF